MKTQELTQSRNQSIVKQKLINAVVKRMETGEDSDIINKLVTSGNKVLTKKLEEMEKYMVHSNIELYQRVDGLLDYVRRSKEFEMLPEGVLNSLINKLNQLK